MTSRLNLELTQRQQLAMTPQLRQAIALLQLSNLELDVAIQEVLDRNPLLRRAPPTSGSSASHTSAPGWQIGAQPAETPALLAHLIAQLRLMSAPAHLIAVAATLAGWLDDNGYLRETPGTLSQTLGITEAEVVAARKLLLACEPTGIGAHHLQECLALQLAEHDRLDPAMQCLLANLKLIETGELRRLRKLCQVDADEFDDMLTELRALDPRPGSGFGKPEPPTIVPDVFARRDLDGAWLVELNSGTLPKLLIDRRYAERLTGQDRMAERFIAEFRVEANWLLRSLDQRARTLLGVAREILRHQRGFFDDGPESLAPMTLADVADSLGVHASTVSRAVANKYIATDAGVFALRSFFGHEIGSATHAAPTTAAAVRARVAALIAAEVPGAELSDDAITAILAAEGIRIARRTVAKYRNSLRIPSSSRRKRQLGRARAG